MKKVNVTFAWSILLLGLLLGSGGAYAAETIHVYTYHLHPPFVIDSGGGQSYELTAQLQAAANGRFDFQVSKVPRGRLNMLLENWIDGSCAKGKKGGCDDNWILLWVNPKWGFGPDPDAYFHWVKINDDSNSIISLQSAPVLYERPDSLSGLKFGGISGHRYVGVDELVASGRITRLDGSNERDNILKLYKKRIDVILLPTSTIRYFMRFDPFIPGFADQLFVAEKKHQEFTRNIMLPKSRNDLFKLIRTLDMSVYQQ